MDYEEIEAPPALAALVRCFWVLRADASALASAEPAIPDGSPEVILSLGSPTRARSRSGRLTRQPSTMLVGQITRPFAVQADGAVSLVAARLQPYAGTWLHQPMATMTDGWRALGGAFDVARREAMRARGSRARTAPLARALAALVADHPGPDVRVVRAVERVVATHGAVSMAALANEVATTPRHLQRLFERDVGISPKQLARIRRVQRVFAAWRDEPGRWASVAARCGYFDQAHLVRDVREIAGRAPAGLVEAMPAFTRLFTPLR